MRFMDAPHSQTLQVMNEKEQNGYINRTRDVKVIRNLYMSFDEIVTDLENNPPKRKEYNQTRIKNAGEIELSDGRKLHITVMVSTDSERIKKL